MNAIETARLRMAPLSEAELEEYVALWAETDAMRYWGTGGPWERDVAERHFEASLPYWRDRGFGKRSIVEKETGRWLGYAEIATIDFWDGFAPDDVEIGWMLTPSAWGRGFGTEAATAVRDEAFERVGLAQVFALYYPENAASGRILEKLGMTYERDIFDRAGDPLRTFRITRERWEQLR